VRWIVPVLISNTLSLYSCEDDGGNTTLNPGNPSFNSGSLVNILEGKTNLNGEVSLDEIIFRVYDKSENPLDEISVYHLQGRNNTLSLAVDGYGRYFPGIPTVGSSRYSLSQNALSNYGASESTEPILEEVVFVLSMLDDENGEYADSNGIGEKFLGEAGNSNRYCLSKDAMAHDYIDVPLGIISFGQSNEEGSLLSIVVSKPLHRIFEKYILRNYGNHDGYEVLVPKTSISLCNEEYAEVVCPITTEKLSQELWEYANVPFWHITGPCSFLDDSQNNPVPGNAAPRPRDNELDYSVPENNPMNNDASIPENNPSGPGCSLNPCIKFDSNHCEEPCISVPSGNRCIYPCVNDRECENKDFPSRCYDLSIFGGQEGKGCLLIPCDEGCPVGTGCVDLTEYPHQRTASGAEPAAAVFTYENCYNLECVLENRF